MDRPALLCGMRGQESGGREWGGRDLERERERWGNGGRKV